MTTTTHRVTMPKEVSNLLAKRAKAEKTTFSGAILAFIEDALDDMSDAEDKRLSGICDARRAERLAKGEQTIPLEEAMKKYGAF